MFYFSFIVFIYYYYYFIVVNCIFDQILYTTVNIGAYDSEWQPTENHNAMHDMVITTK